jgi:hypothetical protein
MRFSAVIVVAGVFLWTSAPQPAPGETIYAVSFGPGGHLLFHFDSASPGEIEGLVPLSGDLASLIQLTLEFDPVTLELYGFGYPDCPITCPTSPVYPASIDRSSGETAFLDWPDFPSGLINLHDFDILESTREVRLLGAYRANLRYSLDDFELHVDQPIDGPQFGVFPAVTHARVADGDFETLAILYRPTIGEGPFLARIGGPGGVPPASSGEVTVLGPLEVEGYIYSFDISADGTAYLLTRSDSVNRLYTLDLESRVATEVGIIGAALGIWVRSIAVAPPGLDGGAIEVPALSYGGLFAAGSLLAGAALWRLRRRER